MTALRTAAQQALEALTAHADLLGTMYLKMDAITALRAALAQQVEPVEPVAWVASKDGRVIYDDASTDDGLLRVSGDFENDEQRVRYAQRIVDKLNAAPPQRKLVLLTAQELDGVIERHVGGSEITDDMYTSMEQFARAVEKASWEKNHG